MVESKLNGVKGCIINKLSRNVQQSILSILFKREKTIGIPEIIITRINERFTLDGDNAPQVIFHDRHHVFPYIPEVIIFRLNGYSAERVNESYFVTQL